MATEENVNPTEGQEQENDYRETLLVRNPDSGQVEAVSKLVTKGDRREVHTVQPLAKNRPAFYPFRSSNAVAAFIRGFKSQKDNPIQFQFFKVLIYKSSSMRFCSCSIMNVKKAVRSFFRFLRLRYVR